MPPEENLILDLIYTFGDDSVLREDRSLENFPEHLPSNDKTVYFWFEIEEAIEDFFAE